MTEKKSAPVNIHICFRAVLGPAFFENQSRMKRKLTAKQRVRSLERSIQDLLERLIRRFPAATVLTVSSDLLMESTSCAPTDALLTKLQILRPMENLHKHDWRKLKRACRIALLEVGADASPERVYSRIKCRGSHDFNGADSPMTAVSQALIAIRRGERESLVEVGSRD